MRRKSSGLPGCFLAIACSFTVAAFVLWLLVGCAVVKPIVRSLFDQAVELCQWSAVSREHADRAGMTARDWCSVARNVQPFVDALLSAQARAELSLEQKQPDKNSLYICPEPDTGPADEPNSTPLLPPLLPARDAGAD